MNKCSLFLALALFFCVVGNAFPASKRHAFTTSVLGNANLGAWPAAQGSGLTGLDAADRICQARAAAAALQAPEEYVAWLSDRNDDAYCHLLGFHGKKNDLCSGQAQTEAGPWFRTDDQPFAAELTALTSTDKVFVPLLIDEFGHRIRNHFESFTATRRDGSLNQFFDEFPDCQMWTSSSNDPSGAFAPLGSVEGTSESWTDAQGAVSCNGTRRLICMQRGLGPPLKSTYPRAHRLAFVSGTEVDGNLAGIAGADMLCRNIATTAGLSEASTYKALLTTAQNGNILNRFENDGSWYRVDGVRFAQSIAQILDGEVDAPLNVTELGEYVSYAVAMTGSKNLGEPSGWDCSAWTNDGNEIFFGSLVNSVFVGPAGGHNWLWAAQGMCAPNPWQEWPKRLYCLSDSDLLLHADFEE